MYTWKDREHVLDMLEMISGNRVNYAMPTPGGVRRDIPQGKIPEMLKKLDYLEKQSKYYAKVFQHDKVFNERSDGLGILKKEDVRKYHIVGPVARASGIREDVRKDIPYLAYDELDWKMVTQNGEDVKARVMVKGLEMFQSISILRQCLKKITKAPKELKIKAPLVIQPNEAIAVMEAPRGELVYHGRSNGTDRPERMRIKTPSFVNIPYSIPLMLRDQQLADLPIIVASIDPCFSCCDRVTILDTKSGEKKSVDETYLRRLRK
jgi:NADH-quinone oxidoreductase subunit D